MSWPLALCHFLVRASGLLKFELKGNVLGPSSLHELFLGEPYVSRLKGVVHHALQRTPGCTATVLAVIKSLSNVTLLQRNTFWKARRVGGSSIPSSLSDEPLQLILSYYHCHFLLLNVKATCLHSKPALTSCVYFF